MSRPVILADNLFSLRSYPDHTLAASSTATGKSVEYLAAGRRIRDLTGWFASTLNSDAYVESTFDELRAFNLLFVDRDHNLAGETLSVAISDDGFTTETSLGSTTVPSVPTPMRDLFDGEIVYTNEGALLWWFGLYSSWAVRVEVAAMGAGLRPEIAGLSVGRAYVPTHAAQKPYDWGRYTLTHAMSRGALAQDSSGELGRYRSQILRLRMATWGEFAEATYPIEEQYLRRRPTVILPDSSRAEEAVYAKAPPGEGGFSIPESGYYPELSLAWEETEPELL